MDIHEIINLYNEGRGMTFIAEKFGTYPQKIKQILIDNGVRIRTRAEQNKITNQLRAKKVNHDYFNVIDSPQKAWLLGFFAADGTVSHDKNALKIALSSVDREILEKIQKEINSERKICDYTTNQGFQISELSWSSENQKRQLAKYSIVPRKTYKEMSLPQMEMDYQLAYFLGYFDGDGCFKNDGQYCRIEICSYRPELLQAFVDLIDKKFHFTKNVYKDKSRQNYYTLTYSTNEAVQILNYIYDYLIDNNCFFLQRKYDKYMYWKEH